MGQLTAAVIDGRLALAAAYCSSISLLQDKLAGMTGLEMCMQLMRQCWSNKPFDEGCLLRLKQIVDLSKELSSRQIHGGSAIELLAHYLLLSSTDLACMYEGCADTHKPFKKTLAQDYWKSKFKLSPRSVLTDEEELRLFGNFFGAPEKTICRTPNIVHTADTTRPNSFVNQMTLSELYQGNPFSIATPKGVAFHWVADMKSVFLSLYQAVQQSEPGLLEWRRLYVGIKWLFLEARLRNYYFETKACDQEKNPSFLPLVALLQRVLVSPSNFPPVPLEFAAYDTVVPCGVSTIPVSFATVERLVLKFYVVRDEGRGREEATRASKARRNIEIRQLWSALVSQGYLDSTGHTLYSATKLNGTGENLLSMLHVSSTLGGAKPDILNALRREYYAASVTKVLRIFLENAAHQADLVCLDDAYHVPPRP
jgi:hypothetical protein